MDDGRDTNDALALLELLKNPDNQPLLGGSARCGRVLLEDTRNIKNSHVLTRTIRQRTPCRHCLQWMHAGSAGVGLLSLGVGRNVFRLGRLCGDTPPAVLQ
jgi:hypothetical protein